MKLPQFRIRTLLLLMPILGVAFVASAKVPVRENKPYVISGFHLMTKDGPATWVNVRPPTTAEWAIRATSSVTAVAVACMLIGGVRSWRARRSVSRARSGFGDHGAGLK